jgi:hypothetical protein
MCHTVVVNYNSIGMQGSLDLIDRDLGSPANNPDPIAKKK